MLKIKLPNLRAPPTREEKMSSEEKVLLEKQGAGLGFTIRGGKDYVHVGDDPGIFVTSIKPNGAAARSGRIGPGDKILEIDGHDLRSVLHNEAVSFFHQTGEKVTLLVDRGAEDRIRAKLTPTDENLNLDSTFPSPPDLPLRRPGRLRNGIWIPLAVLVVIIGIPFGYYVYKRMR